MKKIIYFLLFIACVRGASAQILTHEDSLSAGLNIKGNRATVISGYGEMVYNQNFSTQQAEASLCRAVLFVGHRFSQRIAFFSEMEIENAKSVEMEQAFIKFDLNRNTYISAGLFVPRIGIINENHLPNTFNGVDRPLLETILIPATWREIGVSLFGSVRSVPGLNYSLSVMNGLNAEGFGLEKGIRGGRQEGEKAQGRNKSVSASLLYYYGGWRFQGSSYIGGSFGDTDQKADLLGLQTGVFGTPIFLNEINAQYRQRGWILKLIGAIVQIPDAAAINKAFAGNVASRMQGGYAELGYDVLYSKHQGERQLILFSRYEHIDMNAALPENGIENKAYTQNHLFVGFTYLPHRGVAIKADYRHTATGDLNTALIQNPQPYQAAYQPRQNLLNLGVVYSF